MKVSVIIPTKNPGRIFAEVLDAVRAQATDWPFEIIVIDSGSTDGTVEFLRKFSDVKLIEIPSAEFGHGRTRNLAISKAQGEFCALLTHDARPASNSWLANLVAAVEQAPDIAGAFGPHFAYPEHGAFTKRDLDRHFETFRKLPPVLSRTTDPERYERDQGWRQILHFYSDNNSCLRRSVWQEIPYPDVDFAEDQIWASTVIEAGWKKAYAADAAVFHSHEYRPFEQLQRAFDESLAFRRLFGYRLGGKPMQAIRSAAGLSMADWRWGRSQGLALTHVLRRMFNDVALVTGHSLGARGDWLPNAVRRRLSRDKKLFYSLR
ncbi:MAG TPA: glycosyltransferase family 2 protein [Hyphomicrobium sp.]|nr:glycosyltransferase family 2 protein [Hyphomicrobium sp.]